MGTSTSKYRFRFIICLALCMSTLFIAGTIPYAAGYCGIGTENTYIWRYPWGREIYIAGWEASGREGKPRVRVKVNMESHE